MLNPGSVSDNAYAVASRERKAALGSEFYTQFSSLAGGRGGLTLLRTMFDTLKQLLGEYEHDFIAQLLFPEHYPPARYPLHFPIPTCVFETVEYGFIAPNTNGAFSVLCYPKRLGVWPSWYNRVANPDKTVNSLRCSPALEVYHSDSWSVMDWGQWEGILPPDDIHFLYQDLRMTACVLKLTYMSRLDEVSGYITTCLDYKHNALIGNTITSIDYGLYKRVTHPLEGARAVWFPKDVNDEIFESVQSFECEEADSINGQATGSIFDLDGTSSSDPKATQAAVVFNSGTSVVRGHPTSFSNDNDGDHLKTTGFTLDGVSRMDTDCIMLYAIGLPSGSKGNPQFRVELIRHWEGIPLQKYRQYLYGEKPFTSQRSYDAMKTMGNAFPFFATLTNMEASGAKDVLENRVGELNPGAIQAAMMANPNDIISTIANNLG